MNNKLLQEILVNRNMDSPTIIAICGAADLGKSFLSEQIVLLLRLKNFTCDYLTLDAYLLDRKLRNEAGISGYNIQAYDKEKALTDLIKFRDKQAISFKRYDHKKGIQCGDTVQIKSADILIFEGLHVMHPTFIPFIDRSFFIFTDDDFLKEIRTESDLSKRNYTLSYSKEISETEFKSYKTHIEPYKEKANCLLYLSSKWNYEIINPLHYFP